MSLPAQSLARSEGSVDRALLSSPTRNRGGTNTTPSGRTPAADGGGAGDDSASSLLLESSMQAAALAVVAARSKSGSPASAAAAAALPPPNNLSGTMPPFRQNPFHRPSPGRSSSLPQQQHQQQQLSSGRAAGGGVNDSLSSSAAANNSNATTTYMTVSNHVLQMEIDELKIKLQHERSRAVTAEEALIRRETDLDRCKEELDRVQRESLRAITNAASLEGELTAVKVQLSDALSSRDQTLRQYRELQGNYRQVESARETAMNQVATLTTELELSRKAASDDRAGSHQPITAMLAQLSNRLEDLRNQQRDRSASRDRAPSAGELQAMQRNIVEEAMHRFEQKHQAAENRAMLSEAEKIKALLKEQLDLSQSQVTALETKFTQTVAALTRAEKQVASQKWLLLQRKWLSQLIREYDSCFRQFPSVLPWFRMPQRKCLRVYVWTVIAALRLVRGGSQLGEMAHFNKYFAVSPAKCCPTAVFRKIHHEIDQLSGGNNNASHGNNNQQQQRDGRSSSPVAHLPGSGRAFVVHQQQPQPQQQRRQWNNAAASAAVYADANDISSTSTNAPPPSHSNSNIGGRQQVRWASDPVNASTTTTANVSVGAAGGLEADEISQVLSEIYVIDSRLSRALRSHEHHVH